MKKIYSTIAGAAVAVAMGLALGAINRDAGSADAGAMTLAMAEDHSVLFYQPKLDGVALDVRMMGHMQADPAQTAERFCRDNGYSTVAELMIRPSASTRTIADGAAHAAPGEMQQAFAMIRCTVAATATATS